VFEGGAASLHDELPNLSTLADNHWSSGLVAYWLNVR
jgi:hypothetical protein